MWSECNHQCEEDLRKGPVVIALEQNSEPSPAASVREAGSNQDEKRENVCMVLVTCIQEDCLWWRWNQGDVF